MTTRTSIDAHALPGVSAERTVTMGTEIQRLAVYQGAVYIGELVYVRRKLKAGGSTYGWRPAQAAANSSLTTQVEAVRRLPRFITREHRCSECPDCGTPRPISTPEVVGPTTATPVAPASGVGCRQDPS